MPHGLRDLLLDRVARLDRPTQGLLRLAAAAGRDVDYQLLRAVATRPERDVRESLRQAVEHGVLVVDQATGSFRFRHALLAEAVYATILPGEREELHARLADELAQSTERRARGARASLGGGGSQCRGAAPLRSTRLTRRRLSSASRRLTRISSGRSRSGLTVPDAAELTGIELAELCARTARLGSQVGASTRAIELARRAIELVGPERPYRVALLEVHLGEYLYEIGDDDAAFAALERAVEIAPAEPPSAERAYALGSLAGGLMMRRRRQESLVTAEQALELARRVASGDAEVRALTVIGVDLANLGRAEEGIVHLRQALQLAEKIGDRWGLERVYINFTDVLFMLGRPRESTRLGWAGIEAMRRYGIHSSLIVANQIESLLAIGDWDEADQLSAAALRGITASFPYALFIVRALLEIEPWRVRRGARPLRSRRGHPEPRPRARPLRQLARRPRPLGTPLGRRRRRDRDGPRLRAPGGGGADTRPGLRQGTARSSRTRRARTRPP